jgi:tRNA uridine 5-carbamoylmethylation protein Kti12
MADLFGDAIGQMLKYAVETIKKGRDFGPTLKTSIQTLKVLVPLVEKMKSSNDLLDQPREDIEMLETHMREIKEIVEKSKKLTWRNIVSLPSYQAKLQKKDEALQKHLSVNVQVENKTDLKMLLVKVQEILERLNGNQVRGLCGAPEDPQCMGMDKLLTRLKIEMMKDGVFVRVLTGLGGSGKSTLAKKLCSDREIKGNN